MHTFRVKIGNVIVDVESKYGYIAKICEPYLSDEPATYSVCLDDAVLNSVVKRELFNCDNGNQSIHSDEAWFHEVYTLLCMVIEVLPQFDMLFIHGSAIEYGGKGYIFIAPSGTGKSTHTRLWKERFGDQITVINDDKPFITIQGDKAYVCGTPWRGKHNIGENRTAELGGICILKRGDINEISRISPSDGMREVVKQCSLQSYNDNKLRALELIDQLLSIVPVYRLFCTPDIEAVDVCFNEIVR